MNDEKNVKKRSIFKGNQGSLWIPPLFYIKFYSFVSFITKGGIQREPWFPLKIDP